jgi:hypothetical protein
MLIFIEVEVFTQTSPDVTSKFQFSKYFSSHNLFTLKSNCQSDFKVTLQSFTIILSHLYNKESHSISFLRSHGKTCVAAEELESKEIFIQV